MSALRIRLHGYALLSLVVIAGGSLTLRARAEDPPDAEALVEKLGAPKYSEREAAASALEKLGSKAVGALRKARESDDQEVRSRAALLLAKIETNELDKPTMVNLDYDNVSIAAFVKDIVAKTGARISLFPEQAPEWESRRFSLHRTAPVTLLEALDLFAESASVRVMPAMTIVSGRSGSQYQVTSDPTGAWPAAPSVYQGPFKVSVASLHHHRDVVLGIKDRRPEARQSADRFFAQLSITAELRLNLQVHGQVKIDEAVDDRGKSLLKDMNQVGAAPAPAGAMNGMMMRQRMGGAPMMMNMSGIGSFSSPIELAYPAEPAVRIKTLKGSYPVVIWARRNDPLSIELADAAGKSFSSEDGMVTVHEVKTRAEQRQIAIELTIKRATDRGNAPQQPGVPIMMYGPQNYVSTLEVQDEFGEPFQWHTEAMMSNNGVDRMTIVIDSNFNGDFMDAAMEAPKPGALDPPAKPAEEKDVRAPRPAIGRVERELIKGAANQRVVKKRKVTKLLLHGLVSGEFTVPFEFHDLPIP